MLRSFYRRKEEKEEKEGFLSSILLFQE